MTTDNDVFNTVFEDDEFIAWWKREGGKTQAMDYMDTAMIIVAYKAYRYGLTRTNT